jgi:hypothetical protein
MPAPLLGIAVNLYENAGGTPGAAITKDTVAPGQQFFVEITAQDIRTFPQGVGGLALDIAWDPKVLREADSPFNPADPNSPLVTQNFPVQRTGTLDNKSGQIDELGGSRLKSFGAGKTIGLDKPERFALLKFEAVASAANSAINISIGRGGIGMSYRGRLSSRDLSIERQTVTVKSPNAAAADAVHTSAANPNDALADYLAAIQSLPQWAIERGFLKPWYGNW